MNSNYHILFWLLAVTLILLLVCLYLLYLYLKERKDKLQLIAMVDDMQKQIAEYRHIADNSLDIARKQSENAMFVLRRVLIEREKKEMGFDSSSSV